MPRQQAARLAVPILLPDRSAPNMTPTVPTTIPPVLVIHPSALLQYPATPATPLHHNMTLPPPTMLPRLVQIHCTPETPLYHNKTLTTPMMLPTGLVTRCPPVTPLPHKVALPYTPIMVPTRLVLRCTPVIPLRHKMTLTTPIIITRGEVITPHQATTSPPLEAALLSKVMTNTLRRVVEKTPP